MAELVLSPIDVTHAERLAELHATSFPQAWSATDFADLLSLGASGLKATRSGAVVGFLLWRVAAGEAEILTVAVTPHHRQVGVGRRLLSGALAALSSAGADQVLLEVADDNLAALRLYLSVGFVAVGRRKGYYRREQRPVDAQVLQLKLNTDGH